MRRRWCFRHFQSFCRRRRHHDWSRPPPCAAVAAVMLTLVVCFVFVEHATPPRCCWCCGARRCWWYMPPVAVVWSGFCRAFAAATFVNGGTIDPTAWKACQIWSTPFCRAPLMLPCYATPCRDMREVRAPATPARNIIRRCRRHTPNVYRLFLFRYMPCPRRRLRAVRIWGGGRG